MAFTWGGISVAAVLAAAAVYLLLGAYWYSTWGMGETWLAALGHERAADLGKDRARGAYVVGAIGALVAALGLEALLSVTQLAGPLAGAALGGLVGLAFHASLTAPTAFLEDRDPVLYAIDAAFNVLALVAMGLVVGLVG